MKRKVLSVLLACVVTVSAAVGATGCGTKEGDNDRLVIAVMTAESGDTSGADIYQDLGDYLEEETGLDVEIYEVASYEAGIEALRTGKADMNLFSSFSYYLADQRADIDPLVSVDMGEDAGSGDTVIITQADSDIDSVKDLKGHTFAFVDPASTSGHIVPKYFLMNEFDLDNADDLEKDIFSQVSFAGGHDTVATGVINGQYDAGACVKMVLEMLSDAGMFSSDQYKVIAETSLEGNTSIMAIRSEIDQDTKDMVKEALLKYDNPDFFQSFLNAPGAKFVEPNEEGIAMIQDVAKKLGLDEETLLQ